MKPKKQWREMGNNNKSCILSRFLYHWDMKKLFLCLLGLFSLILLPACFSNSAEDRVESIIFHVDEGSVPPEFYKEVDFVVIPNYDDRTLELNYSLIYPNRTEATEGKDITSEGEVGGENFDDFEEIVKVLDGTKSDSPSEKSFGGGILVIDMKRADKTVHIETGWNDDLPQLPEIQEFYLGLINMLTEDVQV